MLPTAYRLELTPFTDRDEDGPQYGAPRYLHTCATLADARRAAREYAEERAADLIADATRDGFDGVAVEVRPVFNSARYALVSAYVLDGVHGVVEYHDEDTRDDGTNPLPTDAPEDVDEDEAEAEGVTLGHTVTWDMDGYYTVAAPIAYVEQPYGCTIETPALTHDQMIELRDKQEALADRYSDDEFCRLRYFPLWGVWSELFNCETSDTITDDGYVGVLVGDEYEIWPTVIGGTRYYLVGFESQWPWSYDE